MYRELSSHVICVHGCEISWPVTVFMNRYLRAAPIGEEITIEAKTIKTGKSLSFLTVDLTDSKGRLLAQGKHTKFVGGDR